MTAPRPKRRYRSAGSSGALSLALGVVICVVICGCAGDAEAPPGAVSEATARGEPVARLEPVRGLVLISLDTLRADHLGLYGYSRDTSPFLDRLAERAVVFDRAVVQFPSTLTSHVSMLTGFFPWEHGVFPPDGKLAEDTPLLAEVLKRGGFRTAGYTEGGYMRGRYGFRRGFDDFDSRDRQGRNQVKKTFDRGLRFLDGLAADEPFFLFLHTYAVHAPYVPEPEWLEMFWEGPAPPDAFPPTGPELRRAQEEDRQIPDNVRRWLVALYDAEIRSLDSVLEGFFAELDARGVLEDSVVVVTSDHGEEFMDHGSLNHHQLYDEILHVPLLVLHPDVSSRREPTLVEIVGLAPTLAALAGVPMEGLAATRGFSSLLAESRRAGVSEARFAHATDGSGSWSTYYQGRELWHRLRFPAPRQGELYLTSIDVTESNSLAEQRPDINRLADEALLRDRKPLSPSGERERVDLDEADRDELRALGYIE